MDNIPIPYPYFRVPYPEIRVWYWKKIAKITVILSFLNQLIIGIYHFEVITMMHLDFCDPAVKLFLDHLKKSH